MDSQSIVISLVSYHKNSPIAATTMLVRIFATNLMVTMKLPIDLKKIHGYETIKKCNKTNRT